jgi:hypothetical protein
MIGDVLDRKAIAGRTKEQWWIHCVCREYSQQGQFDRHELRFALWMHGDCGLPPDKESNRIPPPEGSRRALWGLSPKRSQTDRGMGLDGGTGEVPSATSSGVD